MFRMEATDPNGKYNDQQPANLGFVEYRSNSSRIRIARRQRARHRLKSCFAGYRTLIGYNHVSIDL